MVLRPALAVLMALLLASPGWGNANVVGNVASSQFTFVRGASLTPGSTVFNGDTLEVRERGSARIALTGNAQVLLAENSLAQLKRADKKVQLAIERGRALFSTTPESPVEALLGDATIRSANGAPAVGMIYLRNALSAFIAADRGTLEIYTAHDGRAATLREGEGMEVTMATPQPEPSSGPGGAAHAGSFNNRTIVLLGVAIIGVATGVALALSRREPTQGNVCLEVSPFKAGC